MTVSKRDIYMVGGPVDFPAMDLANISLRWKPRLAVRLYPFEQEGARMEVWEQKGAFENLLLMAKPHLGLNKWFAKSAAAGGGGVEWAALQVAGYAGIAPDVARRLSSQALLIWSIRSGRWFGWLVARLWRKINHVASGVSCILVGKLIGRSRGASSSLASRLHSGGRRNE